MTNLIHTKREELISFIRKQMEGPGGVTETIPSHRRIGIKKRK